nr:immunoglobulin heavy chain junction region [Mus musculus]
CARDYYGSSYDYW